MASGSERYAGINSTRRVTAAQKRARSNPKMWSREALGTPF